jgi:hypothetical protein
MAMPSWRYRPRPFFWKTPQKKDATKHQCQYGRINKQTRSKKTKYGRINKQTQHLLVVTADYSLVFADCVLVFADCMPVFDH